MLCWHFWNAWKIACFHSKKIVFWQSQRKYSLEKNAAEVEPQWKDFDLLYESAFLCGNRRWIEVWKNISGLNQKKAAKNYGIFNHFPINSSTKGISSLFYRFQVFQWNCWKKVHKISTYENFCLVNQISLHIMISFCQERLDSMVKKEESRTFKMRITFSKTMLTRSINRNLFRKVLGPRWFLNMIQRKKFPSL